LWWSFIGPGLGGLEAGDIAKYSEEAIKLGPANAGALANLSSAVANTDPEKAIEFLKRSVALDPSADNYRQLAALQNQTRHYQDAMQSIALAIALANDRSEFYEERERSEKGLGVSELEIQRHLASGYTTVADVQLKQERRSEAYVTYLAALRVLSAVEKSDSTGAVKTDEAVVSSKLDALMEKSREKISARILTIKEGEGKNARGDHRSRDR
jgi:tetratricopeptide (TPR) repeat protein